MRRSHRRLGLAFLCVAALALLSGVASAQGASGDPLFHYFGDPDRECPGGGCPPPKFPPPSGFEGPCGLAVDSAGDFYVSDYYRRHVDAFDSSHEYFTQLTEGEPPSGPCGLAVDATGRFYVNNYHRDVVRFSLSPIPLTSASAFGPRNAANEVEGTVIDSAHSTGVAVDPTTGNVYVDDRTYIAVYEPSGAPVEVGGEPLRIGEGSLLDGYGVAVSRFSGTPGYVYVPDAGEDVVKVYDPNGDPANPVATIDGHETPLGGFVSLRDAAIAVDQDTGRIYVADDLLPEYFERPEATVYAFDASGAYVGRLKYNVIDALPPGLAVDNSESSTQGRVYVTSGNTEGASVYAYGPDAASKSSGECAEDGPCPPQGVGGALPPTSLGPGASFGQAAAFSAAAKRARAGASEVAQRGKLRVTVRGNLAPRALPRRGAAPVAVTVSGQIATTDDSVPPQLRTLRIELNRHGHLDFAGLPVCPYHRIQPASTARALAACRASLVGQGHFRANIAISGQQPYPARGRLLVFNGRAHGRPALFGQIYAPRPFANSFVIVFAMRRLAQGAFGTAFTASLPRALGNWGYLTEIEMRLGRRYALRGARHSYISAGCPAPPGFTAATFPLARTSFGFAGGAELTSTLTRSCSVR